MTFRKAYKQIRLGKRVRRDAWVGGVYVYTKEPTTEEPELYLAYADGSERPLQDHVKDAWLSLSPRIYKDWKILVK